MPDVNVLVLLGSLRKAPVNRQLVEVAVDSAPERVTLHLFERLGELPFYNEDIDIDDLEPEPVRALRAAAGSADAALVITPEYNGDIPAVSRTRSTRKDLELSVPSASLEGGRPRETPSSSRRWANVIGKLVSSAGAPVG